MDKFPSSATTRPKGEEFNFDFDFRIYGFQEIAMLYFPNCRPRSASRNLKKIIREDRLLMTELIDRGYMAAQRRLTPSQVVCIFRILGSPKDFVEIVNEGYFKKPILS